jgi:deoxyxylulose-5-phosphate synthase
MKKLFYFLSAIGLMTSCDSRTEYMNKIQTGRLDSTRQTVRVGGVHPYTYYYWRHYYYPSSYSGSSISESQGTPTTSERGGFGKTGSVRGGGTGE